MHTGSQTKTNRRRQRETRRQTERQRNIAYIRERRQTGVRGWRGRGAGIKGRFIPYVQRESSLRVDFHLLASVETGIEGSGVATSDTGCVLWSLRIGRDGYKNELCGK